MEFWIERKRENIQIILIVNEREIESESGITFSSIINDSLYDVMTYSKTKAL